MFVIFSSRLLDAVGKEEGLIKQLTTPEPMTNKRGAALKSGDKVTVIHMNWEVKDAVDERGTKSTKKVSVENQVTYTLVEITIKQEKPRISQKEARRYLETLRRIDTHICATPTPVPYIVEELLKALPEYQPEKPAENTTEIKYAEEIAGKIIAVNLGLPIWNREVAYGRKDFQELVIQHLCLKGYTVIRQEEHDGLHLQLVKSKPLSLQDGCSILVQSNQLQYQ